MVEQRAAVLVVEELGGKEIVVGALRCAVDAADERLPLPDRFPVLHAEWRGPRALL